MSCPNALTSLHHAMEAVRLADGATCSPDTADYVRRLCTQLVRDHGAELLCKLQAEAFTYEATALAIEAIGADYGGHWIEWADGWVTWADGRPGGARAACAA